MLFIPIDGLIDGVEKARDRNFSDLSKLMEADIEAQKNTEFFKGAPGREAAINVESETQRLAANNLLPRLDEVALGRSNSILGKSATRSLKGIYDQAKAQELLPNVPELARLSASTQLSNATNANVNATQITPQNQQLQIGRNENSLALLPEENKFKLLQLLGSQEKAQQVLDLIGLDTTNRKVELENSIAQAPSSNEVALANNKLSLLQTEERTQTIPLQHQLRREDIQNTQRRRLLQQSVTEASGLLVRSASGVSPAESIQLAQGVRNSLVTSGILSNGDVISYDAKQGGWVVQSKVGGAINTTSLSAIIKEADSRLNPQRYRNADKKSKVAASGKGGRFGNTSLTPLDSSSIIGTPSSVAASKLPTQTIPQDAQGNFADVPQQAGGSRIEQVQSGTTGINIPLYNQAKESISKDEKVYSRYRDLVQTMLDSRKINIPWSKEMIEQEMIRMYYVELSNGK